jgi:SOS-response transcriptional repressor LexA
MGYGDRITKAREKAGLSRNQLAKKIGVSHTTVENWETEKHVVTKKHAGKLSTVLGLPLSALNPYGVGGLSLVDPGRKQAFVMLIQWSDLKRFHKGKSTMSAVPKPKYIEAEPDFDEDCFALRVEDDSMMPDYQPGEIIIIDRHVVPAKRDTVVARIVGGGEHMLRTYVPRPNGTYDLQAENPQWDTVTVNANRPAEIIGVVVEHRKRRHR